LPLPKKSNLVARRKRGVFFFDSMCEGVVLIVQHASLHITYRGGSEGWVRQTSKTVRIYPGWQRGHVCLPACWEGGLVRLEPLQTAMIVRRETGDIACFDQC
jgi:hypothetical protein